MEYTMIHNHITLENPEVIEMHLRMSSIPGPHWMHHAPLHSFLLSQICVRSQRSEVNFSYLKSLERNCDDSKLNMSSSLVASRAECRVNLFAPGQTTVAMCGWKLNLNYALLKNTPRGCLCLDVSNPSRSVNFHKISEDYEIWLMTTLTTWLSFVPFGYTHCLRLTIELRATWNWISCAWILFSVLRYPKGILPPRQSSSCRP